MSSTNQHPKQMITRSSHNWKVTPGGFDKLKTKYLDFPGDWPILNCLHTSFNGISFANDKRNIKAGNLVSMFIDDYLLERYWNNPEKYVTLFRSAALVMAPDFSLLVGMPKAMGMWNVYRSRLVGHVWQAAGINVVPTITWGSQSSFSYAFSGVERGSAVAVSNTGCLTEEHKKFFDAGFFAMKETIKPSTIIFQCNKRFRSHYEEESTIFVKSFFDKKRESNGR